MSGNVGHKIGGLSNYLLGGGGWMTGEYLHSSLNKDDNTVGYITQ